MRHLQSSAECLVSLTAACDKMLAAADRWPRDPDSEAFLRLAVHREAAYYTLNYLREWYAKDLSSGLLSSERRGQRWFLSFLSNEKNQEKIVEASLADPRFEELVKEHLLKHFHRPEHGGPFIDPEVLRGFRDSALVLWEQKNLLKPTSLLTPLIGAVSAMLSGNAELGSHIKGMWHTVRHSGTSPKAQPAGSTHDSAGPFVSSARHLSHCWHACARLYDSKAAHSPNLPPSFTDAHTWLSDSAARFVVGQLRELCEISGKEYAKTGDFTDKDREMLAALKPFVTGKAAEDRIVAECLADSPCGKHFSSLTRKYLYSGYIISWNSGGSDFHEDDVMYFMQEVTALWEKHRLIPSENTPLIPPAPPAPMNKRDEWARKIENSTNFAVVLTAIGLAAAWLINVTTNNAKQGVNVEPKRDTATDSRPAPSDAELGKPNEKALKSLRDAASQELPPIPPSPQR